MTESLSLVGKYARYLAWSPHEVLYAAGVSQQDLSNGSSLLDFMVILPLMMQGGAHNPIIFPQRQ